MRASRSLALVLWSLLLGAAVCGERPPTEPPGTDEPPPPGRAYLNLELFRQDRHAIEGKWYEYDSVNHLQEPKPHAWIVRDTDSEGATRFAAFRIKSIYDETESGLFTLAVSVHDGDAWSDEAEFVSSRNQKVTGRMCVDLHTRGEVGCDTDAWQVRLEYFKYLAPLSLFYVDNPGVFVRSMGGTDAWGTVRIARVDDVTELTALPDPDALEDLNDGPATAWDSSDWAFDQLAPDLPEAGMAIGRRFVDDGFIGREDLWTLLSFRLDLYYFTVLPTVDGDDSAGLTITWEASEVDFEDASFDLEFSDHKTATVPSPAEGEIVFFRLNIDDLLTPVDELEGAVWPHEPPPSRAWDLAVTRTDGVVRLLVSPSAGVANLTALDLVEEE